MTIETLGGTGDDARRPAAVRVGIVSGEFLAPRVTRIGGFGWAAAQAAAALRAAGDEPVFVCPDVEALNAAPPAIAGVPLVAKQGGSVAFARGLRRARLDVLLTIDYRPSYNSVLRLLPRAPMIVWVRDPRTPADVAAVAAVRVPGQAARPQGTDAIDCTGMRTVARWARRLRRPLAFASPAPDALTPKAPAAYGHDVGPLALLPNPVAVMRAPGPKAPRPRVVFLGRMDPVKRPWVFAELARSFPQAEFVMIGEPHFRGAGAWAPVDLPANLRVTGNLVGEAKDREVDAAWVIVNTSAHEALPASFTEALASRTPLLACVDTERVASRFGIYAGSFGGDGLGALPSLRAGLARLLADGELRARLGEAGRSWVCGRHTPQHFVAAFRELAGGLA
jgi:glycosyltransferase involved in cell wall biosynthesis